MEVLEIVSRGNKHGKKSPSYVCARASVRNVIEIALFSSACASRSQSKASKGVPRSLQRLARIRANVPFSVTSIFFI